MILRLLKKVCHKLEGNRIPYMLSGSLAMNVYTVPRMTRDIDIVVDLQLSDIRKFLEIFIGDYYISEETVIKEIKRRGFFNIIDLDSGQKIDFIVKKNTAFHINEFERRIKNSAYGFDAWIVTIEDLIISKLKWIQEIESDTQKKDIANLLKNPDVELNYVTHWVEKLGLNTYGLI